ERLSVAEAAAEPGAGCRFVAIGRLVAQKNYPLLIEAFALHAWPEDRLTIAGEGPERSSIQSLIDQHELGDRVALAGHSDDVPELLDRSDVLVLSSDYEGLPAVIIEALAAGLPVATTDCCASMGWLVQ